MRPRYLVIEGLQSFKDAQKINFDELSETGLFGIFGPTGSGKSTVLDAITLALYGKVNRANGTQGIINTNCDSVKVTFIFDLLKDEKRKVYRIDRIYSRKKGTENSCEVKLARLIEITGNIQIPVADKATDVNMKVEELIGLNHEDFTRAVVLPQNKFQEFLLMEKAKKREMLERIFYLEEYGKQLNDKLAYKIRTVDKELAKVTGALSALGDVSDEAKAQAETALKEAEKARDESIRELDDAKKLFDESKEIWQLTSELEFVKNKEKEHEEKSEKISNSRELLEKAVKADELMEIMQSYKEASRRFTETRATLEEVSEKLPDLEKELVDAKAQLDKKREELIVKKPALLEDKAKIAGIIGIKKEIDQLDRKMEMLQAGIENIKRRSFLKQKEEEEIRGTLSALEGEKERYRSGIESLKVDPEYKNEIQKAVRLENELNSLKENLYAQQRKKKDLAAKINSLEKDLDAVLINIKDTEAKLKLLEEKLSEHQKSKPGEIGDLSGLIEEYHRLKSLLNTIKSKREDVNSIKAKLEVRNRELIECVEASGKARLEADMLRSELEKKGEEVKRIRKEIDKNVAFILSRSLQEGEPCPVCGSVHHPNPAYLQEYSAEGGDVTALENMLRKAEDEFIKAEAALRAAEMRCVESKQQVNGLETQIKQLEQDLLDKTDELNRILEMLPEEMRSLTPERMEEAIEKINRHAESKKAEINKWQERLDAINESMKKGQDILNGFKVNESSIRSQLQVNRDMVRQIENEIESLAGTYKEKEGAYREFLGKYGIETASKELERILNNEKEIDRLQNQVRDLEQREKTARDELERVNDERRQLSTELAQLETSYVNVKEQRAEKENKIRETLDGIKAEINVNSYDDMEERIKAIDNQVLGMENEEKELSELVRRLGEQFDNKKMLKNSLENQVKILDENLQREAQRFEAALKEKGFRDIQDVEKSVLSKEAQKALKDEIEEYETVRRNLSAQKEILLNKLGGRSITEEEWNKVQALYLEKLDAKDKALSRYEIARNNYSQMCEKYRQWQVLIKENDRLSHKMSMLEELKKLLKGNSFVDFVAEERLRYIAREASETLSKLTRNRYTLELEPGIGFVICDNANGGVHRMVNTLSGGETFITSLCLALALSRQIQLKGQSPLEFFFLDEGIGTLDRELLDVVIDALERLSTKERTIGIISHVPELRQRISRRLIIEPPTVDGFGSKIRIEKA